MDLWIPDEEGGRSFRNVGKQWSKIIPEDRNRLLHTCENLKGRIFVPCLQFRFFFHLLNKTPKSFPLPQSRPTFTLHEKMLMVSFFWNCLISFDSPALRDNARGRKLSEELKSSNFPMVLKRATLHSYYFLSTHWKIMSNLLTATTGCVSPGASSVDCNINSWRRAKRSHRIREMALCLLQTIQKFG
jgi:hypothetical protein